MANPSLLPRPPSALQAGNLLLAPANLRGIADTAAVELVP
jgi:hypothetical protein